MSDHRIVSIYVVFGSRAEAATIGRAMVERRLAACVNILESCHSIYHWQGAIEEAEEVPALFKTSRDKAEALAAAIAAMHSYETPAIVIWPIETANPGYAAWVIAETG
jgi:periplasmic divalent cation tolerance protein